MLDAKTPGTLEAEILMTRTVHQGSFLLVEGPDDSKFWTARISPADCEIVISEGKPNLLATLRKLDHRNFNGALGIVDDDGDSLENLGFPSPNLAVTDAHDLECLLLRFPSVRRKLLAELGDPTKIAAFEQDTGIGVWERLLENGLPFGRLRWLSKRETWELNFGKLNPERFMNVAVWRIDEAELLRVAAALRGSGEEEIRVQLDSLPAADPWYVCQGHDLLDILRLGLKKLLGLQTSCAKDRLAGILRSSIEQADLVTTRLYQDIRGWEQNNPPYRVLPSHP